MIKTQPSPIKYRCGCIGDITDSVCAMHNKEIAFVRPHTGLSGFVSGFYVKEEEFYFALHSCTYDDHGFIATASKYPLTESFRVVDKDSRKAYRATVKKLIGKEKYLLWKDDICTKISEIPQEWLY